MDKAPDAFRTISEVAAELDIPQHVLRFWETRFAQIKPMKRSGGRRYYRPDDVDLLRGIRRLLYGEGYTIRGVQRILKEHGIKSVQSLTDNSAPSFGEIEEAALSSVLAEDDYDEGRGFEADPDEEDGEDEEDFETPATARRATEIASPVPRVDSGTRPAQRPMDASLGAEGGMVATLDIARLETVLQDLIECRELLDRALKQG